MKNQVATSLLIPILTSTVSLTAFAAPPVYELSCRAQAKEIAAQTYKTCLTDNRNAELEQIKRDYQAKLNALKDQYQADLKKMAAAKASNSQTPTEAPAASTKKASALPDESEMDLPEPVPSN